MIRYDNHLHTCHSHDSNADPDEICRTAIEKGLAGITFTDHVDISYKYKENRVFESIGESIADARRMRERYGGRLEVFAGFEIGEGFWYPERQQEIMNAYADKVDAVLCSVHNVSVPDPDIPTSMVDFSAYPRETAQQVLTLYFNDLLRMLDCTRGDILCHLTYPLRYLNLRYGLGFSLNPYRAVITRILQKVIELGMALEINASNLGKYEDGFLMPDADIVREYRALGGRLVTLGSDAHKPCDVGSHLEDALRMLHTVGFTEYFYYRERTPVPVKIEF